MPAKNKLEIIYKKTDELIPYARNARTHSPEQVAKIAASIKEFSFLNPVIIDGDNGIVAGHGRVLAMQKLKKDEVPCVEAKHLTEAQKKAYIIADNKLALDAGWDEDLLKVEFEELKAENFDTLLTGFSEEEIETLLIDCESEEIEVEKKDNGISQTNNDKLTFGKYKLTITNEEFEMLENRLTEYTQINGSNYGFVTYLIG